MPAVFLTGFPGFLGSALAERLLDRYPEDTTLVCLVQSRFRRQAAAQVAALARRKPHHARRIGLFEGDLALPGLGLGERTKRLQREVRDVYHLAAVYDLGVAREVGLRVNVDGTRQVLRFAEACPALGRLHYVSTCYVSGRYEGTFGEDDLVCGQRFNNYYEETKYLAEVEVQQWMRAGFPATVYRPAIVVGDSTTGATEKYDGPYYFLQWILRWKRVAPVPVLGDPRRHAVNVVPRDFALDALDHLSRLEASRGQVYQLCDPLPATVQEMMDLVEQATGRRLLRLPLPHAAARAVLRHIPSLARWTGIPPEIVDYLVHPTQYTCHRTLRDLQGTGIHCPPFAAYVGRLVGFLRRRSSVLPQRVE